LDVENESVKKHSCVEHAYKIEVTENICEIGIQTNEIGVQVNKKTREIGIQVSDNMAYTFESYIYLL
ncbi:5376_t:CDS:1, partial [Cetraspora pellucida]